MEEKHVQFGRRKLDVLQTSLGIPVVLTILGIITAGMASYYGSRLSVERNFSDIKERITVVEAKAAEVDDLKKKSEITSDDTAALRIGMAILLNDRGYNAEKILTVKKP